MTGLRLEEADEGDQEGGHRFNMKGEVNKSDAKRAKHAHVRPSQVFTNVMFSKHLFFT